MAAFSEVEMCWRGSGGSRKMRMVEVVAVSQLDAKPMVRGFWSCTVGDDCCSHLSLLWGQQLKPCLFHPCAGPSTDTGAQRWAWRQQALWFFRTPESGLWGQNSQQCHGFPQGKPQASHTHGNCRVWLPLGYQNYQLHKNSLLQSLGAQCLLRKILKKSSWEQGILPASSTVLDVSQENSPWRGKKDPDGFTGWL